MKSIMLAAVRFYRSWISPVLPGSCRFVPTCSAFAQQALERHGAWKGTLLTAARLLKCHPFHPGGVDPVPDQLRETTNRKMGGNGDIVDQAICYRREKNSIKH